MGKQHNKIEKRNRRKKYLIRKKARDLELAANEPKSKPAKKAATKKAATKKAASKKAATKKAATKKAASKKTAAKKAKPADAPVEESAPIPAPTKETPAAEPSGEDSSK